MARGKQTDFDVMAKVGGIRDKRNSGETDRDLSKHRGINGHAQH